MTYLWDRPMRERSHSFNQAVKRNISRFSDDFMFQLNGAEAEWLVSQNVIPHRKHFGGTLRIWGQNDALQESIPCRIEAAEGLGLFFAG